jgi:hypothetical protein
VGFHDAKTIEVCHGPDQPQPLDEIKEAFEKFGAEGFAPRLTDILCQRDTGYILGGRGPAGRLDRRRARNSVRFPNECEVIQRRFPIDPDAVSTGHLASRD